MEHVAKERANAVLAMLGESAYGSDIMRANAPSVQSVHIEGYDVTPTGGVKRKAKNFKVEVTLAVPTSPDMCNSFGFMHGGFVGYLMDTLSSVSIHCIYDEDMNWFTTGVTQSLQILYLRPVPANTTVKFVSRVVMINKNAATTEGLIYDQKGVLLAKALQIKQDVKIGGAKL